MQRYDIRLYKKCQLSVKIREKRPIKDIDTAKCTIDYSPSNNFTPPAPVPSPSPSPGTRTALAIGITIAVVTLILVIILFWRWVLKRQELRKFVPRLAGYMKI